MRNYSLNQLLELQNKTITLDQFKDIRNNEHYVSSAYMGESNNGNSYYNVELKDDEDIDIWIID